ncbi:hypothetical protein NONI108955_34270 [Nocardia ninae]|uniref:DUF1918 domain-containing protein n=1 Tax=Nocardia ninae NBRC 108245 TaxID=1210091 RepID=A0A511MRY9_9NOCA|nr:hypothetical protein [Nocardia ninae]GEM43354.1 hypothetical protein NN4_78730 [Nocardia ninae NBRC 108245]
MVDVGDRVLVAGGASVFEVLEIDGEHALVESIQADAPGRYPFPARVSELVPVDTDPGGS